MIIQSQPIEKPGGKRGEGFPGQRMLVLNDKFIRSAADHPLLAGLFPVSIGHFPSAHGHFVDRHRGLSESIFIACLGGEGFCEFNSQSHRIHSGTAILIPAGQAHVYGAAEDNPWSISWIHSGGRDWPSLMELLQVSEENPLFHLSQLPQFEAAFEQTWDSLKEAHTLPQLIFASAQLRHLFAGIALQRRSVNEKARTAEEKVSSSAQWMGRHFARHIRLEDLARASAMSIPHYSMLFRKKFGCSPIEFLIGIRVQRACRLFDHTTESISEIAAQVGYDDPYYFSRIFKKTMSCSPKAYRNTRKG
ncbi:MAG: AraC family transcriptional regulator [Methylacidiphilales bacterium]|nr:AraC family transcriptional regulator [Candidatus Methylacidiphilales bacterium]